jgi:hypothetical protein
MKRLTAVSVFSLAMLLNLSANAQSNPTSGDSSAVRATVTNYIEAYYTGDANRMQQTLHPHYVKLMLHGDILIRQKTATEMLQEVRDNGPVDLPAASKAEKVTVLDITGNIASAKLVTPGWTDYMTLSKADGRWKILSVVQQIHD